MKIPRLASLWSALAPVLVACGSAALPAPDSGIGPNPALPEPQESLLPTAKAVAPDYGLGSHVAALGLAFSDARTMPQNYASGAFIGEHGSWNRRPHSGYKVVFVPFADGRPSGPPVDFLAGFLSPDGNAHGRPVGVALDGKGGLLVADDVGNVVWRVAPASR